MSHVGSLVSGFNKKVSWNINPAKYFLQPSQ